MVMNQFIRSSVLILYRHHPHLELLVAKRSEDQRAFPDNWVFPGGCLSQGDEQIPLDIKSPTDAHILAACAVRETFEETGVLAGFKGEQKKIRRLREQWLGGKLTFEDICQELRYQVPVSQIINLGRRVTPPISPVRFDTLYFLMEMAQKWEIYLKADELSEGGWIAPQQLMEKWWKGEANMHPPVRDVLEILGENDVNDTSIACLQALANDPNTLYHRIPIHPGIEIIPLRTPTLPPATHTNCYLVGDRQFVVIDPASPYPEEQAILDHVLDEKIARGQQPLAILLTHHHEDHVGGVQHLKERLKIPVMAHPLTAQKVASKFAVEHLVTEGETWDLGRDPYTDQPWLLQALFTPGHAPGHLCFLDLRHRIAIVGDMVAGTGTILIAPPDGNMAHYLHSLERLSQSEISLMFPSHGPMIAKPSAYCQQYIQHRLMREDKIVQAFNINHLLTLEDLLPLVYNDVVQEAWGLARQSLLAHLEKLLNEDRIEVKNGGYALSQHL